MGIPGLINAIGTGERISLSKLAVSHLERTARPIRVAVDISIWLFQVQAGRGGKNPELRTLFFRLLKLLSLPVHPLFVYDGQHKPPFKRGKAVSARSYGSAPIIRRSRDLIERFRFPWHEAPGEAEAECARLQRAGIVDAVMSNDVDALMFGSTMTIMNFSKESGTGTSASTHVTCYRMGNEGHVSNVPLSRAGMILFAMLSGGDYLPSGVPKCGSKLAAQIAKAQFGDDLLREISSQSPDLDSRLNEWRERLQFELEENESGWFTTKHKAVQIPETFPDRVILKYYAEPIVSTEDEMAALRRRLRHAWDCEIDPSVIRSFAAEYFEWNYRSGARKVIKLLAEPLISYRLRLQRPIMGLQSGTLAPDCDTPWMQKIHKSRANFGTDGTTELQMDMLPIDVVGIDLLAEEPNPPLPSQETMPSQSTHHSGDEEDPEVAAEAPPPTPSKSRVTKRYNPLAIEKVWIFETVARLGVPEIVKKWGDEQAAKAAKAAAPKPKKATTRRTEPKKKGPIDPSMMRGSILKYGTLTKERSELSSSAKTQLLEAATSTKPAKNQRSLFQSMTPIDPEMDSSSPSMYSQHQASDLTPSKSHKMADLIGTFSTPRTMSTPTVKRHPMATQSRMRARAGILASTEGEIEEPTIPLVDIVASPQALPKGIKFSHSVSGDETSTTTAEVSKEDLATASLSFKQHRHGPKKPVKSPRPTGKSHLIEDFGEATGSLSPSLKDVKKDTLQHSPVRSLRVPASLKVPEPEASRSPSKTPKPETLVSSVAPASSHGLPADVKGIETLLTQPSDSPPNTPKRSKSKPRACTKTKDREPGPTPTAGHLENLTTSNGFWTVETLNQSEDDSTIPRTSRAATVNSAQLGQKKADKKKRVPRVSILDLV
ncbi:uncharacterized protein N7498_003564 [Penicillium cinerascens]|uniref:XPG-I domain-containing protein n=1 Tax=Penicillium cinerascens TaxID=70096 RepID=A0A9W9N2D8_9EURO|nr:uncharacterized protein N7498_003564 [Penicillium cinerascens]KAJ5211918.1 hypothetical protein N7498_003564 [Penicillium cinerascens]